MRAWLLCGLALVALLCASGGVGGASLPVPSSARLMQRRLTRMQQQQQSPVRHPFVTFAQFENQGTLPGDDPLAQVRSLIGSDADIAGDALAAASSDSSEVSFVEAGAQVGKVRSFCEICILVMQMKQRGQPHLCAGLNTQYHLTCIEVLESVLRADKAVVYWLTNGCMHMDSEGPEIVRPCPAINICSWVPNLFADSPSMVRDGVESLCPKDPKFLPTIPQEFRNLLATPDSSPADNAAVNGPVQPITQGV